MGDADHKERSATCGRPLPCRKQTAAMPLPCLKQTTAMPLSCLKQKAAIKRMGHAKWGLLSRSERLEIDFNDCTTRDLPGTEMVPD